MLHPLTIIYKSGAKVHVKARGFTVTKNGSEVQGVRWDKIEPNCLVFGVDEVAAIYEGKV